MIWHSMSFTSCKGEISQQDLWLFRQYCNHLSYRNNTWDLSLCQCLWPAQKNQILFYVQPSKVLKKPRLFKCPKFIHMKKMPNLLKPFRALCDSITHLWGQTRPRVGLEMSARPPTSAMATDNKPKAVEIPEIVVDPNSKRRYERGRFLGKVRLRSIDLLGWVLLKCQLGEFAIFYFEYWFFIWLYRLVTSGWICQMLRAEGLGDGRGKKFADSQNQINSS